jgi:2-keto-4-pentenoate hydratase
MDSREFGRLATMLIKAEQDRRWIGTLPESLRPGTAGEAYAVQDSVVRMSGRSACGWKVGCTSKQTQALLGTPGPIAGRVFAERLYRSPAAVTRVRRDMPLVEAEFAFTLALDLPPSQVPYGRTQVLEAVGSLHLAFEIVESRFENWRSPLVLESIADNASHGALVLSAAIPNWRAFDLPAVAVRLHANGTTIAEGEGRRVLGDPLEPLIWLADFLSRRGLGLKAGEVVTTGTCVGAPIVPLNSRVLADFDELGRIELQLSVE